MPLWNRLSVALRWLRYITYSTQTRDSGLWKTAYISQRNPPNILDIVVKDVFNALELLIAFHLVNRSIQTLQWHFNKRDGVSNHRRIHCLLNCWFMHRERKHQSSAPLAFVRGIHRWSVNSPHKTPVLRKIFPFDDVIMGIQDTHNCLRIGP